MSLIRKVFLLLLVVLVGGGVLWWWRLPWDEKEYYRRWVTYRYSDIKDFENVFPQAPFPYADEPFMFPHEDKAGISDIEIRYKQKATTLGAMLPSSQTTAFLIIKDGQLIYEVYPEADYTRDSINTSFSIAKSLTGLLIGIAIDQGYIGSVDDPITEYLPELYDHDPKTAEIHIQDLLNMRSGLSYADHDLPWGDKPRSYYHPNTRRLALSQHVARPTGTFEYDNYNSILLGLILEKATGRPVYDYFQDVLWSKIRPEYDGSWNLDSDLPQTRMTKMESGINARAIDFAKLAYLMLQEGSFADEQIVPLSWYTRSTQPDPKEQLPEDYGEGRFYQNGWWIQASSGDTHYMIEAQGHLGQYLFIFPEENMVIVRFGKSLGGVDWEAVAQQIAGAP